MKKETLYSCFGDVFKERRHHTFLINRIANYMTPLIFTQNNLSNSKHNPVEKIGNRLIINF